MNSKEISKTAHIVLIMKKCQKGVVPGDIKVYGGSMFNETGEKIMKNQNCNAEQLGCKEGDFFKVVSYSPLFSEGSVVELVDDDGSTCPRFKLVHGGSDADAEARVSGWYEFLYKMEKIEPLNASDTDKVTKGDLFIYPRGEGAVFSRNAVIQYNSDRKDGGGVFVPVTGTCSFSNAEGGRPGAFVNIDGLIPLSSTDTKGEEVGVLPIVSKMKNLEDESKELEAKLEENREERSKLLKEANDLLPEGWKIVPGTGTGQIDGSKWTQWEVGDRVVCVEGGSSHGYERGQEGVVSAVEDPLYDGSMPVRLRSEDSGDIEWVMPIESFKRILK